VRRPAAPRAAARPPPAQRCGVALSHRRWQRCGCLRAGARLQREAHVEQVGLRPTGVLRRLRGERADSAHEPRRDVEERVARGAVDGVEAAPLVVQRVLGLVHDLGHRRAYDVCSEICHSTQQDSRLPRRRCHDFPARCGSGGLIPRCSAMCYVLPPQALRRAASCGLTSAPALGR
jgi:hypothetical protein